jgi:CheY-like chemotaxis protein
MEPQNSNRPNKVIMVVDDDDSVRSFIQFSLESEGYKVIPMARAALALKQLETKLPDLILLDIMMPQINGIEMCRRLKSTPQWSKIPVIFITAYVEPKNLDEVKKAGAQGLMEKPLQFDVLVRQITDALNGRFSTPTRFKFGQ